VGAERKTAKDHGSFVAKYKERLLEFGLGCWESSSFCRWCRVETEPTALQREASPPAGSCALKSCYSFRWLLKVFYSETTSARRGRVPSKTPTTKVGVARLAWRQGRINHGVRQQVDPLPWYDGLMFPRTCHLRGVGASSRRRWHNRMAGENPSGWNSIGSS